MFFKNVNCQITCLCLFGIHALPMHNFFSSIHNMNVSNLSSNIHPLEVKNYLNFLCYKGNVLFKLQILVLCFVLKLHAHATTWHKMVELISQIA